MTLIHFAYSKAGLIGMDHQYGWTAAPSAGVQGPGATGETWERWPGKMM